MRLYLRLYLALLASLALLGFASALLLHFAGGPMEQAGVTVAKLVENVLAPSLAPAAEQQAALQKVAAGLNANVTLFSPDGTVMAAIGRPLPHPRERHDHPFTLWHWDGSTVSAVRLPDGRFLAVSVPGGTASARFNFHVLLLAAAVIIGLVAFPIVRQLTGRLERLQRGVDSLGGGDLGARVAVEGRDEIASLAASFNRAAGQIEQLILANRSLLANASHELRTPLARLRLAVEMLKQNADPKTKAGLEQDIAELDQLVDEILLASRLDTVAHHEVREDIDLLALAAEECARYEHVDLQGTALKIQGDPRLLKRLLRNLLENAQRHGVPPTEVRLRGAAGFAVLEVCDAGPGPAPGEFEHLFTPFYRRRSPSSTGNGLGLSLVRQIARRHGGDARCERLGHGRSGFVVTLANSAAG